MREKENLTPKNNIQRIEEMEKALNIEDIGEGIPLETRVKNIARRIWEDPEDFYRYNELPAQIGILHTIISPTIEEDFSIEGEV
jgi:hypothetical protein